MTDRETRKFQIRSGGFGRSLVDAVDASAALHEYPGFPPATKIVESAPDGSSAVAVTAYDVKWEAVELK